MMNKGLIAPLTPEQQQLAEEKLLAWLARQIRRYTGGDSSVPEETARELLESLCYVLGVAPRPDESWHKLVQGDMRRLWEEGQSGLTRRVEYGQRLWQLTCEQPLPVNNVFLRESLSSVGQFWRQYDRQFLPKQIPCSIDYQPLLPVAEELAGVDYVNCWLERCSRENAFLAAFAPQPLIALLKRWSPDPLGLPANMCEPVLPAALALLMLEREPQSLELTYQELPELAAELALPAPALTRRLQQLIPPLLRRLKLPAGHEQYFCACCIPLAGRLSALPPAAFPGVFFPQ